MRRRFRFRTVLRLAVALLFTLLVVAVGGWVVSPEVRYVARAGVEEARILLGRKPIADVAADPGTDVATRDKLSLVLAARDFAALSLGLDAGETYTTYSRVRRDTLVLVLTASRYDRLAEKLWSYPVVGRVPYKGFFRFDLALKEARRLEQTGMDTYIRPSSAFSTLGWFNDPLLSTTLRGDSVDLAATVIHEILHNTVFLPGHVDFNESFANFVGYRGAEAFFRGRGDSANAARAAARWRDELRLGRFYAGLADRLEQIYAPGIAGPALRAERRRIFRLALSELGGPVARSLETIDGRALAERPINNAVVIAQRLYRTRLDRFEQLLTASGGDVKAAIAAVRQGVEGDGDPWAKLAATARPAPSSPAAAPPRRRAR
ncbi:MAG: aminopeptidase [Gemmatimonadetes bacterium]|nr:aminopeptidase [Gemmatimonadota bacterium]